MLCEPCGAGRTRKNAMRLPSLAIAACLQSAVQESIDLGAEVTKTFVLPTEQVLDYCYNAIAQSVLCCGSALWHFARAVKLALCM